MINEIFCKKYGDWRYVTVELDGRPLEPGRSQQVINHSPDGFSWGYGGSGPGQLALALLLAVSDDEDESVRLHREFKDEFVALWPGESHIAHVDIAGWMRRRGWKRQSLTTTEEVL